MKVQCSFCEYEVDGFCVKKKQNSHPTKIKLNKRRTCGAYSEDVMKVLEEYRKKERHLANVKRLTMKRAQMRAAINKIRETVVLEPQSGTRLSRPRGASTALTNEVK